MAHSICIALISACANLCTSNDIEPASPSQPDLVLMEQCRLMAGVYADSMLALSTHFFMIDLTLCLALRNQRLLDHLACMLSSTWYCGLIHRVVQAGQPFELAPLIMSMVLPWSWPICRVAVAVVDGSLDSNSMKPSPSVQVFHRWLVNIGLADKSPLFVADDQSSVHIETS